MLAHGILVDVAPEARLCRKRHRAIADHDRIAHDVVAPRHVVVFVLQDLEIADSRAEVDRLPTPQRAVGVVRGEHHAVRARVVRHLLAHRDTVPDRVGHDRVDGVGLEKRLEALCPVEGLADAQRRSRGLSNRAQHLGIQRLGLQPQDVEGLQGPRELEDTPHTEAESDIEADGHVAAEGILPRPDPAHHRVQRRVADVAAFLPEQATGQGTETGLDCGKAGSPDMQRQCREVGGAADRRQSGVERLVASGVGKVDAHAVAHLAAQELVDRNAESLALQVEHRGVDPGDGLVRDSPQLPLRDAVQLELDRLGVHRTLADDARAQVPDRRRQHGRRPHCGALGPAHQSLVRAHLDEVVDAPPASQDSASTLVILMRVLPRCAS